MQPDNSATQSQPSEAGLSQADDRIIPSHWLPPQTGVIPRVRILFWWVNVLWAIPIGIVFLVIGIAVAQGLRTIPAVQQFIVAYPGQVSVPVYSGFPGWLQWQHFINFFLIFFIIRSGLQILADHPRLYWNRNSTPGTEWFRFQHKVPRDRVWTSKDDSVTLPGWLGIPGIRHSVGLARKWHFSFDLFWLINGIIFYIMLFTTNQWERLVPLSWNVFPNAVSTAIQYLSLTFPANQGWTYFNGLQQITYFITVFIAAPAAVGTGLMQSPAISNKAGWLGRLVNRQVARTIHFAVLCWFIFFVVVHVTMIFITGLFVNLNHMFAGNNSDSPEGFGIFCAAMLVVIVTWFLASPMTIRHARFVQNAGDALVGWIKGLAELWKPTNQYSERQIAPFFWPNGTMPKSAQYEEMVKKGFTNYSLRVGGLVESPKSFSFAELKSMPKQEQITEHFCIQGWSGVAKWGGVPMDHILDIVKPTPEALYAVFYSLAPGSDGGLYYDVCRMRNMRHPMTILAYEMNGKPVSVLHGAPLRLRVENELGFKMVKWIEAIEFVRDFHHLGAGKGGYNEDHEFYGYRDPI
ncbi:MAG: molybdopterin-dependent oxidoreductase [Terriglobia bacterium]